MCDSNRCDVRHTRRNYKFFRMVPIPFRDFNGYYTSVRVRQLTSGVRWGEGTGRCKWGEGSRKVKLNIW